MQTSTPTPMKTTALDRYVIWAAIVFGVIVLIGGIGDEETWMTCLGAFLFSLGIYRLVNLAARR